MSDAVGRIRVTRTGAIWFDGTPVTLQALAPLLQDLRSAGGVVWYYREQADDEPAPEAMAVVRLVIEHRLPISMSTRPDFADVVMPDGSVAPRAGPHTLS
ncbi:MAG TPA: hypothetical protein VFU46_02840 [Gemmatimonadales bacterium]|nr:hypothetical protein [Gemmatimonadales bacterium]